MTADHEITPEDPRDRMTDLDLVALLGAEEPPDLKDAVFSRLQGESKPVHDPGTRHRQEGWSRYGRVLVAVGAVAAVLVFAVRLWSSVELPGLQGSREAVFDVNAERVDLRAGGLVVEGLERPVWAGVDQVDASAGRAVVVTGVVDVSALDRMFQGLNLDREEVNRMSELANWRVVTGLSVCVLSGSVACNGQVLEVKSGDEPRKEMVLSFSRSFYTSRIQERTHVICRDEASMAKLWRRHSGDKSSYPFLLDCKNSTVVAVFAGKSETDGAPTVDCVLEHDGGYTLRYRPSVRPKTPESKAGMYPCTFFVFSKTDSPVRFEFLRFSRNSLVWEEVKFEDKEALAKPVPTGFVVHKTWSGPGTKLKGGLRWIDNLEDWNSLWATHRPKVQVPFVDFTKRCVVVSVSSSVLTRGVSFVGRLRTKTKDVLRLQIPVAQTIGKPKLIPIYGFFEVTRPAVKLVVEFRSYGMIGGPVRWYEAAEFGVQRQTRKVVASWVVNRPFPRPDPSVEKESKLSVIRTAKQWQKTWEGEFQSGQAFALDFRKFAVIVVRRQGQERLVRYAEKTKDGRLLLQLASKPLPANSVGYYVVPRVAKSLEVATQSADGVIRSIGVVTP